MRTKRNTAPDTRRVYILNVRRDDCTKQKRDHNPQGARPRGGDNIRFNSKFEGYERTDSVSEIRCRQAAHRVHREKISQDVILKLDKDNEKGNKIAVITLRIPGGDLRVEEQARTFEEAIDNSLDVMKRQIEKAKARI